MPSYSMHLSLIGLLLSGTMLSAAEIPLSTTIDAVTVYADGASISRTGALKLTQGENQIVVSGLPATVNADTLRLSGEGLGALAISSIDTRITPGSPVDGSDFETKRRALSDELETARGKHEGLTAQKTSMLKFASALPSQLAGEKSALGVDQWPAAWQAIGNGIGAINRQLFETNKAIAEIEAKIVALENAQMSGTNAGAPQRQIVINVSTETEANGQITLTYQSDGASWQPIYDARLVTSGKEPKVELTRRAMVSQQTGEDWTNVALTLATTRLSRNPGAPRLDTLTVGFEEDSAFLRKKGRFEPLRQPLAAAPEAAVAEAEAADAAPAPRQIAEASAAINLSAYQASFSIRERVTLPMDGTQKGVLLSQAGTTPELVLRAVPALEPVAYLEAKIDNAEDAPLLPGIVNLRRDDMFIGRGMIEAVATGEKITLGFGADDLVKVTRVPIRKKENDPNPNGTKSAQEDFRTSVKNLHDFPVKIVVQDRLPVSENTAITVEPLSTNTPATEKLVDQRRGVSAWNFELAPQENKDVRFGWRIRHPADRLPQWNTAQN
jgi:uncharacterized protein (TIGR02231 family)